MSFLSACRVVRVLCTPLAATLLVAGCWGWIPEDPAPPGPVAAQAPARGGVASGSAPAANTYTVVAGDTLFSIAWRFRLKVSDLAAWNNLGDGSLILVDQRIRLTPPPGYRAPAATAAPAGSGSSSAPAGSGSSAARGSSAPPARKTGDSAAPAAPAGKPPQSGAGATAAANSSPGSGSRPAPKTPAPSRAATGSGKWRWPAQGRIDAKGARVRSGDFGLRILGRRGQDINAADSGKVMYAGDGLKAYGLLVIVRHSPEWLSAYGHNEKILVREGQDVSAGQPIATMGTGPGNAAMLHFEIRRNGKPVEPRGLLPPRG